MIKNIIKKSFFDIVNHTSLSLIFVLFLLIFNFVGAFMAHSTNRYAIILSGVCLILLIVCFFAGWFQLFKEIAKNNVQDNKRNPFGIYLEGVGKNIVPVILGGIFYTLFLFIVFLLAGKIAFSIFGSLNFLSEDTIPLLQTAQGYGEFLNKLTDSQKAALSGWIIINLCAMGLINMIFMFYAPYLIKEDNKSVNVKEYILRTLAKPFYAFMQSIKLIFKNFLQVICLCALIVIIYLLIGTFSAFFSENRFLELLILFIRIYFLSFVIMLVFNYYEAKSKENNCDNGCDSVG